MAVPELLSAVPGFAQCPEWGVFEVFRSLSGDGRRLWVDSGWEKGDGVPESVEPVLGFLRSGGVHGWWGGTFAGMDGGGHIPGNPESRGNKSVCGGGAPGGRLAPGIWERRRNL